MKQYILRVFPVMLGLLIPKLSDSDEFRAGKGPKIVTG
jgi:hypothetical protein